MANYLTFSGLKAAIQSVIKQFTGSKGEITDYLINSVYLSEICSVDTLDPLFWLVGQEVSVKSVAPATISSITKANPGVITTAAAHGLSVGDIVEFSDVAGMTEINELTSKVASTPTSTTFTTTVNTTDYTTYTSGGTVSHRGVTLSTNVDHIIQAGWNGYSWSMNPVTPQKIEEDVLFHNDGSTAGPPQHYNFRKAYANAGTETDELWWYPGADGAYLLRYWYKIRANRLSGASDVPLLPPQFHDVIIAGVVSRLIESNGGMQSGAENASIWPAIYATGLAAIKKFNAEHWANVEKNQIVKHFMQ